MITFAYRPVDEQSKFLDTASFEQVTEQHQDLFDPEEAKEKFKCDAYYVDFNQAPHSLAQAVTYWCNLFSHSRFNNLWKGILQVELNVDDTQARTILETKKQELLAASVGGNNA